MTRNIDGNVALPGETLRYTISYENIGNGPLLELVINDSVPAFTELVPGSQLCPTASTPTELTACTPSADAAGSLKWSWAATEKLNPGSAGNVSYEVRVE